MNPDVSQGLDGAYHNEVLARGLADDAAGYLLQRNRWAIGATQVCAARTH